MATIVTRSGKGSALTIAELDANFNNLNTGKLEETPTRASLRPTLLLDFAKTKTLDPRVSFTRASTATYYDGKTVAKAEENLLTYSQDFFNAVWSGTNGTSKDSTTTTAPDGSSTALELSYTNQFGALLHNSFLVETGKTYTISFWCRRNSGSNTLHIFTNNGAEVGSFSPTSTWTRYSFTYTHALAANLLRFIQDRNASGFTNVQLWGCQVEERSTLTAYTPTTTTAITNYIPQLLTAAAGVPRFDHNPTTGESLGLLVEEQRTNQCLYSEDLSNAFWTTNTASVSLGFVAPNGTISAYKLIENTSNGDHRIGRATAAGATNSTTYTLSFYAKPAGRTRLRLYIFGFNNYTSTIDLSSKSVVSPTGGTAAVVIFSDAGNGWVRVAITDTTTAAELQFDGISLVSTGTTFQYTGDGWSGVALWGLQRELGSFVTSYIPTVASTVQRNADAASMTGTAFSSWYAQDQGSVYAELTTPVPASTTNGFYWQATDGTSNNRIELNQSGSGDASPRIAALIRYANSTVANFQVQTTTAGWTTNNVNPAKISVAYKVNDVYLLSDRGNAPNTAAPTAIPNVNQVIFSGNYHYKKLAYFPKRLTNAELQAITT